MLFNVVCERCFDVINRQSKPSQHFYQMWLCIFFATKFKSIPRSLLRKWYWNDVILNTVRKHKYWMFLFYQLHTVRSGISHGRVSGWDQCRNKLVQNHTILVEVGFKLRCKYVYVKCQVVPHILVSTCIWNSSVALYKTIIFNGRWSFRCYVRYIVDIKFELCNLY